ncbi:MAG TPA: energy-coupling factor ABC transporter substrate-binding protein [Chitinispirillaceae bacterium]|nr:energy-coupling factor ABC transporter substrate-binding protein [Chitinispirillaceae bacterium]
MKIQNIILIIAVIVLAIIPLLIIKPASDGAELFSGADGQAEILITEIRPDYTPWFAPLWEPPSGEIESLLFALQAAIGSGLLFYTIGFFRGRKKAALVK